MSLDLEDQYDKIYTYCYFKVKNKEIAEDLTQETFLKYFGQNTYISRGKPLAYLYTIARNQCIDYYRRYTPIELEEEGMVEDKSSEALTNLVVKQAISKLPQDLAEVILLRFANEMGIGEIAIFLGVSRFAVYRKMNTALKTLKGDLEKEDFYA